jgi:hypothetical protein
VSCAGGLVGGVEDSSRPAIRSEARVVGEELLSGFVVYKQFRKLLLQGFEFRAITNLNIGVVGIVVSVVLMIILGAIECLKGHHLGHDWLGKDLLVVELRDIVFASRFCSSFV